MVVAGRAGRRWGRDARGRAVWNGDGAPLAPSRAGGPVGRGAVNVPGCGPGWPPAAPGGGAQSKNSQTVSAMYSTCASLRWGQIGMARLWSLTYCALGQSAPSGACAAKAGCLGSGTG